MGTMRPDFSGDVAFVTGASGGMGRAISIAFAAAGARVVMADVDAAGGAETERLVRAAGGGDAVFVQTDVSDAAQIAAAVATTTERFGRLDCAVNAAAIENESAPLHECADDLFDRMQQVNLRGTFLSMKHEIGAMLAPGNEGRGWGDREHRLHQLVPPPARSARVHRVEARRDRDHPERRDRLRAPRDPDQRDLPRLHRHADAAPSDGASRSQRR